MSTGNPVFCRPQTLTPISLHAPVRVNHSSGSEDSPLFAVVECAGTQYKLSAGDTFMTEKMVGFEVAGKYDLDRVSVVGANNFTVIGRPNITSARVQVEVQEQCKTKKVIVFKKKRRKGYQKKQGHRAEVTIMKVVGIEYDAEVSV